MSATIIKSEPTSTEWNDGEFDHYFLPPEYKTTLCGYVISEPAELHDEIVNEPCPICLALYNFG